MYSVVLLDKDHRSHYYPQLPCQSNPCMAQKGDSWISNALAQCMPAIPILVKDVRTFHQKVDGGMTVHVSKDSIKFVA